MLLVVAAVAVAGPAAAHGPALHDSHPCPGASGYTCATLDVPLDHAHPGRGTLHLRVGMGDNVHAPHGVLLVLSGGPGQPGLPILHGYVSRALSAERQQYRIVVFDQRGTGAGALDCKALQHEMGSSDLTPPKASAVRACARKLGSRRQFFGTDDVVADMEDSAPGARRRQVVARRHLVRHVRRRALRAGPSVACLEARPRLGRAAGGADRPRRGGVRGSAARAALRLRQRLPGRPRGRRAARSPRAAAVRRADVRQHRRPDVPQVLERAGSAACGAPRPPEAARQVPRRRLVLPAAHDCRRARPGPPRERALRRLALSVGQLGRAARRPRREAPSRGRADSGREALPVRPADGLGERVRTAVPAVVADRADAGSRTASCACRRCSSTATTTCRRRSPGRGGSSL